MLGKNEFLAGIVGVRTNGPPPSGPPPLARRSERRKEVATLAGIFPKKSENESTRNGEGGGTRHPFPLLPPFYPGFAYFSCPTCATRAVTRETRTSMQNGSSTPLLIVSHADTRIVHLMARARRVTRRGRRF